MVIGDLKWPVNIHHLVHWEEIRIPYFFLEVTPGTMDEAYLRRMLTLRCAVFPYWYIGKEFGCLTFSWKLHLELWTKRSFDECLRSDVWYFHNAMESMSSRLEGIQANPVHPRSTEARDFLGMLRSDSRRWMRSKLANMVST